MQNLTREKNLETCLVISLGFIGLYIFFSINLFIYISLAIGIMGLISNTMAKGITWIWYKLAEVLGAVVSRILLTILYFLFLVPIAFLSRISGKNPLILKKLDKSYFIRRDHNYVARDLENPW
jgi:hypothetical protein